MTALDLRKLRELAEAATPGPWTQQRSTPGGDYGYGVTGNGEDKPCTVHTHGTRSWSDYIAVADHGHSYDRDSDNYRNMEFIAMANPSNVMKLLDAVELMKAALELIAAPKRSDGTYNRCREACEQLARTALESASEATQAEGAGE